MSVRPRAWSREHPFAVDSISAVMLLAVSALTLLRHSQAEEHANEAPQPATAYLLAAALILPLAFRRKSPTAVFVVIAAVAFMQWLLNMPPQFADLAILVALFTVAGHARRWEAGVATGIVCAGVVLAVARWRFEATVPASVAPMVLTVAAFVIGDDLRNRRAYLAELEERAGRLERERDAETLAAVAAERANITRELHDVVAHNIAVMVIQADAATYAVDTDAALARQTMIQVTKTGRQALDEMRNLLGVLRPDDQPPDRAPQPDLEQIPELVDSVRQAGLHVDLHTDRLAEEVSGGVQLAIYRIVQEALTNILKHAGPHARASVDVTVTRDCATVRVDNDAAGLVPVGTATGPGQGLLGMRERAAMYNGTVDAEPRPDGGFTVHAVFPVEAAP